jgi:hypothetical protein
MHWIANWKTTNSAPSDSCIIDKSDNKKIKAYTAFVADSSHTIARAAHISIRNTEGTEIL